MSLSIRYGQTFASRGENLKRTCPPSTTPAAGMRPSNTMVAWCSGVMPGGAGILNSATPNASASSAAVVSRVKTVFRSAQTRTNRPPHPPRPGSGEAPLNRYPTEGLSPIFSTPARMPAKKSPSAPRPLACVAANARLSHSPDWSPPTNQPRYVEFASIIQSEGWWRSM